MTALALAGAAAAGVAATAAAALAVTAARVRRAELDSMRGWPGPVDAIAVMGGQVTAAGPCAELAARLDHALTLFQSGVAPAIIVSGGVDGTVDEVAGMTEYLVARGLRAEQVLPGQPGHNTRATIDTLARLGQRYVVVSSPYHAHRIAAEARRRGVRVEVSCPRTPETRRARARRVRFTTEVVGSIWYSAPARLTARVPVGSLRHSIPHRFIQRPSRPVSIRQPRPDGASR